MSTNTAPIPSIGQPVSRIEGPLKVTGKAKYAGEYPVPGLLHGYVINSTITRGTITSIDVSAAKDLPGVIEVFTHENHPPTAWLDLKHADMDAPPGKAFKPLADNRIVCHGQPIGLVVAESFELARRAATLVRFEYKEEPFATDLKEHLAEAREAKKGLATLLKPPPPKPQGDFDKAYAAAPARAAATFFHGTEHHNPLELFATTTEYLGEGRLRIYDKTQSTVNSQVYVANVFGLHFKDVQVIAPYVGGAFGSGLRPQHQLFMSAMAALALRRSVRVTLDRSQMFTFGHRPPTLQHTAFGADEKGRVHALHHSAISETSRFEDYTEMTVDWSHKLYPAEHTRFEHQLVPLDVFTPLDMRAPGGSTGMHAVEITMDMLAHELGMDPLHLRLVNYTEKDPSADLPFSSKELRQCYLQGAEKFGWSQRGAKPRSMRRGRRLVGYGMATGMWDAMRLFARVQAIVGADGRLEIRCAVTDIGTGTVTVMTQIAADAMGMALEDVTFSYADSSMPFAPLQGGSFTVATVGSAIAVACQALKKKLFKKARQMDGSPLHALEFEEVEFFGGRIVASSDAALGISFGDIIAANKNRPIQTTNGSMPNPLKTRKWSRAVHSAVFVEVEVDEELGIINVTRALTAVAAGRIINPKTAGSQILGGMVWGISKALREETLSDPRFGKYMNANLAEYHIPVHADIHDLDVIFVEENDTVVNDLGIKGVGEIGVVGMPPAIANAIFHATGKRINDLPIHFDKLLQP
ncbi:MAG: xanthine dehydrogenase family protein molybdopterin-binding subunit [Prosthecobacter sp.]